MQSGIISHKKTSTITHKQTQMQLAHTILFNGCVKLAHKILFNGYELD